MPEDEVWLQPGAQLSMIRDLQRRLGELERQNRQLLIALCLPPDTAPLAGMVCLNSACQNSSMVPHMAEQPYGCPRLVT